MPDDVTPEPDALVEAVARAIQHDTSCSDFNAVAATRAAIAAMQPALDAAREAGRKHERERIIAAVEHEADVTPCVEDAKVTRELAQLIAADFSYDTWEEQRNAVEAAEAHLQDAAREAGRREGLERAAAWHDARAATWGSAVCEGFGRAVTDLNRQYAARIRALIPHAPEGIMVLVDRRPVG